MTGDVDYELLIACRVIADLDSVLTCLRGGGGTEVASAEPAPREGQPARRPRIPRPRWPGRPEGPMPVTDGAASWPAGASTATCTRGCPWPLTACALADGEIAVGGVSLAEIAAQHGTPAYVLDTAEFRARCATYRRTFHDEDVAYAGKALLTRAIARMVDEEGLRLDVCSEGELAVAVAAQFPADRIILHGNAKPSALLRRAMPMGVGRIVIDSLDEIETLAAVAFGAGRQRVLLRVTPGVDAHTHNAVSTGTEGQKFGLSIESSAAAEAVRRILAVPKLDLVGLHCHIGSQITQVAPYEQAARRVLQFRSTIRDEHGLVLPELNLGGGHAIAYHPGDVPLPVGEIAVALRRTVTSTCADLRLPAPRITVEPGRAIAGPAGITLYRVLGVKHTAEPDLGCRRRRDERQPTPRPLRRPLLRAPARATLPRGRRAHDRGRATLRGRRHPDRGRPAAGRHPLWRPARRSEHRRLPPLDGLDLQPRPSSADHRGRADGTARLLVRREQPQLTCAGVTSACNHAWDRAGPHGRGTVTEPPAVRTGP